MIMITKELQRDTWSRMVQRITEEGGWELDKLDAPDQETEDRWHRLGRTRVLPGVTDSFIPRGPGGLERCSASASCLGW